MKHDVHFTEKLKDPSVPWVRKEFNTWEEANAWADQWVEDHPDGCASVCLVMLDPKGKMYR